MSETVPVSALNAVNGSIVDSAGPLAKEWPAPSGSSEGSDAFSLKAGVTPDCMRLAEVAIYEHINWGGATAQTTLNWRYVGDFWNDKISSIVVLGGRWRFYEHIHYGGRYWDLEAGQYASVPNDIISSFQLTSFC